MSFFGSWQDIESWLDATGPFHMDLGLGRMLRCLDALDLRRPPYVIAQVLGTNGKGSTSAFLERIAREHGIKTGLYTSPHFVTPGERIRIDGQMLPQDAWLDCANRVIAASGQDITYFEFLTLVAICAFAAQGIELAIMEAGLGGINDATTALVPQVQLFAPIAMDHAAIIGPDMGSIARDKAGAIKTGSHVFSAPQYPVCAGILQKAAEERGASLAFSSPAAIKPAMAGAWQRINAGLAIDAWRQLCRLMKIIPDEKAMARGLERAFMPGRMQHVPATDRHPELILDGAHNPHGMHCLTREKGITPTAIICSFLGDKDWRVSLGMLCRAFGDVPMHIVGLANSRAADARDIAACRQVLAPGASTFVYEGEGGFARALAQAGPGPVLATGSLYLVAEFFALFPQYLEEISLNTTTEVLGMAVKYDPDSAWKVYADKGNLPQMRGLARDYIGFLNKCKTERETVAHVRERLLAAGFAEDFSASRVVVSFRGKCVFAAVRGSESLATGLNLIAAHADSPRLDLKQHPFVEQAGIAQAKTHYYGGIRKYQWLARPLALHGIVMRENGESVSVSIGENPWEPVFCIADLLPHLAQRQAGKKLSEAFEGEKLNIVLGHRPADADKGDKADGDGAKRRILDFLYEKYDITEEDVITAELEAVPAGPARFVGLDESMIGGYGQDDRICVFCALEAFLEAARGNPRHGMALIFWDKEEIGSDGATGASSRFLQYCLEDLVRAWEPDVNVSRLLMNTRAISADVTAALDPDYQDVHEKENAAKFGYGPCFSKFTGSRGKYGANDADAEFFASVRGLLNAAGIPWQAAELGKVDLGGGGTVALFLAAYGMNVIDCGPALLSMHSPFELSSMVDVYATKLAYREFLAKCGNPWQKAK